MAALGLVFITLPVLAIVSFTCFAAFRAQENKMLKILAQVCLAVGVGCLLVPVAAVAWGLYQV
ncbi:hypothetical protein ACFWVP_30740 [Streptomyces sp. NPDC058637]|uniref:hypothetical protein n=1 Tax=Streptomyces sp. NPDC058637 TaxID=3346569 RepID=UPI00364F80A0